jgi:hypothetical protein
MRKLSLYFCYLLIDYLDFRLPSHSTNKKIKNKNKLHLGFLNAFFLFLFSLFNLIATYPQFQLHISHKINHHPTYYWAVFETFPLRFATKLTKRIKIYDIEQVFRHCLRPTTFTGVIVVTIVFFFLKSK